uniref:Uncharacterized protein n=1 Tax=Rhizophora mucronata TaxID=61149 RepID=A0A2P2PLM7_RHIMU
MIKQLVGYRSIDFQLIRVASEHDPWITKVGLRQNQISIRLSFQILESLAQQLSPLTVSGFLQHFLLFFLFTFQIPKDSIGIAKITIQLWLNRLPLT